MKEDPAVVLAEAASAAEETDLVVAVEETSADQEKCTKQCAQIVVKNVKYHSSLVQAQMETHDQSIVEIVTKTIKNSKSKNF